MRSVGMETGGFALFVEINVGQVCKPVLTPLTSARLAGITPSPVVCLHGKSWQDSLAMVRRSVPEKGLWLSLSPEFYTVFWTLSLSDIYIPQAG